MRRLTLFRIAHGSALRGKRVLGAALATTLLFPTLSLASAQTHRPAAPPPAGIYQPYGGRVPGGIQGPHLSQWMENHRNLTPAQQQHALENEPGFRLLRPEQQRREIDLLNRLNSMSPEQRHRYIAHTEAMERLSPPQRQQVRNAMQQLGSLPEDRRRIVAHIFRDVRNMPEPQRQMYLNSPQMRGVLNDRERWTLNGLILVNPYLPPPEPVPAPMPPPIYRPVPPLE
ncbi:DUF3106 domain-containing protein [Granulicella sp. WH15]|uniref:DUF3106 domain-containing protein n=1 Tax=Granulicella sp. WH15 TaxID=2602070 RepID=UPI00136775F7|nr:DUF3106 domain-containing protein [Granulicella sp. WH15]QHN03392.1 DUF3106 domain-containing protein [Granulicella sp. WH15]